MQSISNFPIGGCFKIKNMLRGFDTVTIYTGNSSKHSGSKKNICSDQSYVNIILFTRTSIKLKTTTKGKGLLLFHLKGS